MAATAVSLKDELLAAHANLKAADGAVSRSGDLVAAARTLLKIRRWPEAIAAARGAIALEPDDSRGWALCGAALHGAGRLVEAVEAYTCALNLDDRDLLTSLALATAHLALDEADQAEALASWVLLREESGPGIRERAVRLMSQAKKALQEPGTGRNREPIQ